MTMKLLFQKKILILMPIILLVILPITLLLYVKTANATVPVLDSDNLVKNTLTSNLLSELVNKEVRPVTTGNSGSKRTSAVSSAISALTGGGTGANANTNAISALTGGKSMDALAWSIANTFIEGITRSTINWINSGFQGNPMYITNLRGFLLDIADAETANFIEGTALEALCSPWKLDIKIALALPQGQFEREVRCTLSDIVTNMDDFINGDFSQGGWAGWFELTTKPQNNPYGLYLMTASELDQRIAGTQQEQTQLLNWANGFLSQKKCQKIPVAGPPGPDGSSPSREVCEIVTPGSLVEEKLNNAYFSGQRRLEVADEMDEVISALLRQLINKIIGGASGGLRGLKPSYTNLLGSGDTNNADILKAVKDKFVNEIDLQIQSETDYKNIKQGTVNAVLASESLLSTLSECYTEKLGGSLSSADKIIAEQRINNVTSTIATQITFIKTAITDDIVSSVQNLTTLSTLRSKISNTTSLEGLNPLDDNFSTLLQSGVLNGSDRSLKLAQNEQSTVTAQMSSLNVTTNT
ncbi:MAG: hypothetical protein ACE5F2_02425, partial [Candidatus Paceibacteria bacterium]